MAFWHKQLEQLLDEYDAGRETIEHVAPGIVRSSGEVYYFSGSALIKAARDAGLREEEMVSVIGLLLADAHDGAPLRVPPKAAPDAPRKRWRLHHDSVVEVQPPQSATERTR